MKICNFTKFKTTRTYKTLIKFIIGILSIILLLCFCLLNIAFQIWLFNDNKLFVYIDEDIFIQYLMNSFISIFLLILEIAVLFSLCYCLNTVGCICCCKDPYIDCIYCFNDCNDCLCQYETTVNDDLSTSNDLSIGNEL